MLLELEEHIMIFDIETLNESDINILKNKIGTGQNGQIGSLRYKINQLNKRSTMPNLLSLEIDRYNKRAPNLFQIELIDKIDDDRLDINNKIEKINNKINYINKQTKIINEKFEYLRRQDLLTKTEIYIDSLKKYMDELLNDIRSSKSVSDQQIKQKIEIIKTKIGSINAGDNLRTFIYQLNGFQIQNKKSGQISKLDLINKILWDEYWKIEDLNKKITEINLQIEQLNNQIKTQR